ncbi:Cgl0159 family (beta/alpha)8-fold protein [Streptosporangium canum]|uniref:Cgl0159 family (beta/alpha)8-fold protein n=1 Tax=Streptosporangium canum TaxID=324952 RepID=UPI003684E808
MIEVLTTGLPAPPLGGDPGDVPRQACTAWREALRLPGVRGLVVGRALLYPSDDGVAAAVGTGAAMLEVA